MLLENDLPKEYFCEKVKAEGGEINSSESPTPESLLENTTEATDLELLPFPDEKMGLTEEDSFKKVKADSGEIDSDDYTNPKGKPKRTKIETTDLMDPTGEDSFEKLEARSSEIDSAEDLTPESKGKRAKTAATDVLEEEHPYLMVAYQKMDGDLVEHSSHVKIKFKEEVKILDLVMDNALRFFPAKVLARLKTVAKEWKLKISTPIFARDQSYYFTDVSGFFDQHDIFSSKFVTMDHSVYGVPSPSLKFLPERVLVRSSCSGLLFCQSLHDVNFYICNPVSKEWKTVSPPQSYWGCKPAIVLAVEPSLLHLMADYLLICATPQINFPAIIFDIYSSKNRYWEYDVADCWNMEDVTLKDCGLYANGFVYWETLSGEVLYFELCNKSCGTLLLPPTASPNGILTQMNGELCYIHSHNREGNAFTIDIYGGLCMTLKRSITFNELAGSLNTECRTLGSVTSDTIAVMVGGVVYTCHLKTQKVELIYGDGDLRSNYFPYVNSLTSLG